MAKDYNKIAREVVTLTGGPENIEKIMHCMTRLRMVVKDESKVKVDALKQTEGVIDVIIAGGQYQVVIGTSVTKVYDAALKAFPFEVKSAGTVEEEKKKKNPFSLLIDTIAGVFLPIIPALGAVGILKGILVGCTTLGVLSVESDTYIVLYALAQGFFYFLPIALAVSSAERFKVNKFVALSVVLAMVYPDIIPAMGENVIYKLFGFIPLKMIDYTSTVIPPIVVVWMISKIYKFFKKIIPEVLDMILTPLCTVVVAFPLALLIVGPATYYAGVLMAQAYQIAFSACPVVACAILGLLWPITIVFGLHWGFIPIAIQQISTFGYDSFSPITVGSNFATMGACLGVFLKTKNKKVKEVAGGATFSAILGGITEPGVYGVTLKYKKPFIMCCIFTCIGGIIMSLGNAQYPGIMTVSMLTLPTLGLCPGGMYTVAASLISFVGTAIGTYFFGFNDNMIQANEK